MSRAVRALSSAALLVLGLPGVVLATAGPALAADPLRGNEGEQYASRMGVGATLLLYVAVPLVILLGTAALVWLPGLARANRYRPTRGWTAPPLWFAGPPDPVAAVQDARAGVLDRGGASGSW